MRAESTPQVRAAGLATRRLATAGSRPPVQALGALLGALAETAQEAAQQAGRGRLILQVRASV